MEHTMKLLALSALLVPLTLASDVAGCAGSCVPGQDDYGETSFVQVKSSFFPAGKRRQPTHPDRLHREQAADAAEPASHAPADFEALPHTSPRGRYSEAAHTGIAATSSSSRSHTYSGGSHTPPYRRGTEAIMRDTSLDSRDTSHKARHPSVRSNGEEKRGGTDSKAADSATAMDDDDEDDAAVHGLDADGIKSRITPSDFEAIGTKADELDSSLEGEEEDPKKGDDKAAGAGGKSLAGYIATAQKDEFIDREKARSAAFQEWLDVQKGDDKKVIDVEDEVIRHLYDDGGVKKA